MALVVGTNSYISVADADIYFSDNLQFDSWDDLTNNKKSRALVTASGQISLAVIEECKLPFTPPTTEELEHATAELALAMTLDSSVITQKNTGSNTRRVKAGSAEVEFFNPQKGARFPPIVTNILAEGGCIGGSVVGSYSFGNTGSSSFCDQDDRLGREEGLA